MSTTIKLIKTSITTQLSSVTVCVHAHTHTWQSGHCIIKFQGNNAVLLTITTMLYIRFPELILL